MNIHLPINQDLTLTITDIPGDRDDYPTSQLQKGLGMNYCGVNLTEEAVGFGLPVLKRGWQAIFPGKVRLDLLNRDSTWVVTAIFTMNLVEKISRPGTASLKNRPLYAAKDYLAAFIRHFPPMRAPLTALSSGLRRLFNWGTTYEDAGFNEKIKMVYTLNAPMESLLVEADTASLTKPAITEMIVMNEQGARAFDQYQDSSGICLTGNKIGCWDEVTAGEASFASSRQRVAFSLPQVAGARLFRGRELIGSRLAWAGFGYSFPPTLRGFSYSLKFENLT